MVFTCSTIYEANASRPPTQNGEGLRQGNVEVSCIKLGMSPNLVRVLDKESGSRKNLASKLVRQCFSFQERESSNVMGLKRKKRLDPARMKLVGSMTSSLRPIKPGERAMA